MICFEVWLRRVRENCEQGVDTFRISGLENAAILLTRVVGCLMLDLIPVIANSYHAEGIQWEWGSNSRLARALRRSHISDVPSGMNLLRRSWRAYKILG